MLRNLQHLLSPQNTVCRNLFAFRYATNVATEKRIKYTDTINLPKTKFPPRLSAAKRAEVQENINNRCFVDLYKWQRKELADKGEEYILHDGPPYANGDLHMGHAVNKILKDIILRQNIIKGKRVHYRPGWDCHGLPIELKAMTSTEKRTDPLEIRQKARSFASSTLDKQRKEFAAWGVTADWNAPDQIYRTMDTDYVRNQLLTFYDLYEKDLIYRDMKPVFWSPSSKTALAEAELEYDHNYQSPSLTLRLRLQEYPKVLQTKLQNDDTLYALVWTTTPWSLPANQAVCVNSDLEYSLVRLEGKAQNEVYLIASDLVSAFPVKIIEEVSKVIGKDLIECRYVHPINKKELHPIWTASHVQATKGTGLVHTAPAHGPDDFLAGLEHGIKMMLRLFNPKKCLVNDEGRYNADAPEFLRDATVLDGGNDLVLENVRDDVIALDRIVHSYPIDWRTKKPVLIRASEQWFINTEKIKANAIDEISRVQVFPRKNAEVNTNNLIGQLRKRPYWCISRQRAWGTPIPVFYNRQTAEPIVDKRIIQRLCELLSQPGACTDFWWTLPVTDLIPTDVLSDLKLSANDVRHGDDILDIWFDSGISWSYALEANQNSSKKVADLYLEGIDQFTGWFQSSLMTSVAVQGIAPYKSLFVHGFAVDENGLKMSKSMGNIIVPGDIIEKYGVDTLRWWVAHHATQHTSIPVSQTTLQGSAESVHKIRATLKYIVGCLNTKRPNSEIDGLQILDKYFLNSLYEFQQEMQSQYESHQYNRAAASILNFVTNNLSACYLHLIKDRLYCGTAEQHATLQDVLYVAFVTLNKTLWPIIPFLVEECWSYYDTTPFYKSNLDINLESYKNEKYKELIDQCLELKHHLNQTVRDANTWTVDLCLSTCNADIDHLYPIHSTLMDPESNSELCEILQVSSVNLIPNDDLETVRMLTRPIDGVLCARCRRFAVPSEGSICGRCAEVLSHK